MLRLLETILAHFAATKTARKFLLLLSVYFSIVVLLFLVDYINTSKYILSFYSDYNFFDKIIIFSPLEPFSLLPYSLKDYFLIAKPMLHYWNNQKYLFIIFFTSIILIEHLLFYYLYKRGYRIIQDKDIIDDSVEIIELENLAREIWLTEKQKTTIKVQEVKYELLCFNNADIYVKYFIDMDFKRIWTNKFLSDKQGRLIDIVISLLTKEGRIPSVVGYANDPNTNYKKMTESILTTKQITAGKNTVLNNYDVLAQIQLLDHSIGVASEVINSKDSAFSFSNLGLSVCAALCHDLGKIPAQKFIDFCKNNGDSTINDNFIQAIDKKPHNESSAIMFEYFAKHIGLREYEIEIISFAIMHHHSSVKILEEDEVKKEVLEALILADKARRKKEIKLFAEDSIRTVDLKYSEKENLKQDLIKAMSVIDKIDLEENNINKEELLNDFKDFINSKYNISNTQKNNNNNKILDKKEDINTSIKNKKEEQIQTNTVEQNNKKNDLQEEKFQEDFSKKEDNVKINDVVTNKEKNKDVIEKEKSKDVIEKEKNISNIKKEETKNDFYTMLLENEDKIQKEKENIIDTKNDIELAFNIQNVEEFIKDKLIKTINTYKGQSIYAISDELYIYYSYNKFVEIIKSIIESEIKANDYTAYANYYISYLYNNKHTMFLNPEKGFYFANGMIKLKIQNNESLYKCVVLQPKYLNIDDISMYTNTNKKGILAYARIIK